MLTDSLNMDDLDANLFSSFSSQRKKTVDRASPKRRDTDIQMPSKSGGNLNPRGIDSSLGDASTTKKGRGDVDMGELSKLLGTEDIMKDLSSAKKPVRDVLSMRRGASLISPKPSDPTSEKIKDGE